MAVSYCHMIGCWNSYFGIKTDKTSINSTTLNGYRCKCFCTCTNSRHKAKKPYALQILAREDAIVIILARIVHTRASSKIYSVQYERSFILFNMRSLVGTCSGELTAVVLSFKWENIVIWSSRILNEEMITIFLTACKCIIGCKCWPFNIFF